MTPLPPTTTIQFLMLLIFFFFFMAKSREITPSPFHHIWYFCNWNAPLYKNSSDLVVESLPYFTSLDKRATLSCFLKSSSFFISCLKLLLPPNKTNKQIQQANKQCMSPSMFLHIMKINFDSPYVLMNCLLDKGGGGRPNVPNPILAMPGLWEHLVSLPLANRKYKVTNLSTEKSSNDRLSQGSTCFHLSPIHGSSQSVAIVSNIASEEIQNKRKTKDDFDAETLLSFIPWHHFIPAIKAPFGFGYQPIQYGCEIPDVQFINKTESGLVQSVTVPDFFLVPVLMFGTKFFW